MIAIKLALRNLLGAGLRTWLNVLVLSIAFVIIIWHKGMLDGWDRQAKTDMIAWECGAGQYWHANYDPYDPFKLTESHATPPASLQEKIQKGILTPLLITQGTIYPGGRMQSVLLKGIDPSQEILKIPAYKLDTLAGEIPVLVGHYMAQTNKLKQGDIFTLRWRTAQGAFDATEAVVVGIFKSNVPTVDAAQVWLALDTLQTMMNLPGEATVLVASQGTTDPQLFADWEFRDQSFLLSDVDKIIKAKSAGGAVIWFILMLLAMLAIFDTQVLSIFRRQKEIGTIIALGMTKGQVIRLFTFEGAMHSLLAMGLALLWGTPLLYLQMKYGITLPGDKDTYGIAMSDVLYPTYSLGLVITTSLVVFITTSIVSYLPSRKIARMNPTEAIKGKVR